MTLPAPAVRSRRTIGRYVTCTVVSVMPYMFTSRGRSSPCRSNQGASVWSSSASPPKMTYRSRRSPGAASEPSWVTSWRNADGVWFSTVTPSSISSW